MNNQNKMESLIAAGFDAAYMVSSVALALLATNVCAEQSNQEPGFVEIKALETKVVDGFFIGLAGRAIGASDYSTNSTSPDDELFYVPWTTSDPAWVVVPAEPEYAYQVELLDTNGVAVPKTELGKRFGTKFFDFNTTPSKKGIAIRPLRANKKGKPVPTPCLFYPHHTSDLFKIDKPGHYTLRIRFQILTFPRTGPNRRDYTNDLIRFPPMAYPLFKAANSSTNAVSGPL